jgi:hypothetical protein
VVAAFINGARCGVATVKDYDGDVSFVISVSGPQVTGCALNGAITFQANGMTASPTAKNDLGQDRAHHEIELTLS